MIDLNLLKDKLYEISQKYSIYDITFITINYLSDDLLISLLEQETYLYKLKEFIEYYKLDIDYKDRLELFNIYKTVCLELNNEFYKELEKYIN